MFLWFPYLSCIHPKKHLYAHFYWISSYEMQNEWNREEVRNYKWLLTFTCKTSYRIFSDLWHRVFRKKREPLRTESKHCSPVSIFKKYLGKNIAGKSSNPCFIRGDIRENIYRVHEFLSLAITINEGACNILRSPCSV